MRATTPTSSSPGCFESSTSSPTCQPGPTRNSFTEHLPPLTRPLDELRNDSTAILRAALDAVDAARLVGAVLASPEIRMFTAGFPCVLAAGKAALAMFRAVAGALPIGPAVIATHVGSRDERPAGAELFDAGHPAPTPGSLRAGARALALAAESRSRGGLLVLLSGGASAMLALPVEGVTLDEKVQTSRLLMAAGAPIDELNCVRKHLSQIKGGRLAAAAHRTATLALSDVHAPRPDDPSVIGSGPTVADPTTFADALDVIRSRGVGPPAAVLAHLERGASGGTPETVKPGDPRLAETLYAIVGNRHTAVRGARRAAEARGYTAVVIEEATAGEAAAAGRDFVIRGMRISAGIDGPAGVIGSGETIVTVRGTGRGGRNQEFALAAAEAVAVAARTLRRPVVLVSAGTDGIDGPTDAAGALVDPQTLTRAASLGLEPAPFLGRNDAYRFFERLDDLIRWGPTGTNVGDVHILLVG